ncbi:MAG: PD40 domain-containing protein [Acidobacteria bacterium]|nr:PD40 domain-containing protein [Acidobacteriota bacterium]
MDRKGVEQPLGLPPRPYERPRLSPDGRLLAVVIESDIWVYDIARATLSRLTYDGGNTAPLWSPDGKRIVYSSASGGRPSNLFWKAADGSGQEERLTVSEHQHNPHSFSPDGKLIAFTEKHPVTGPDIWVLPLEGDPSTGSGRAGKPRLFLQTQFTEGGAKFSPDGRWLAYASDESGRYEIYVQPFPGPGGKWQISTDGGTEPVWGRNGKLFYRSGDRMMVVETNTQPTFNSGTPRLLFQGNYGLASTTLVNYSVTADGQRFVMIKPIDHRRQRKSTWC